MKKLYVLLATIMLFNCFATSANTADEQVDSMFAVNK